MTFIRLTRDGEPLLANLDNVKVFEPNDKSDRKHPLRVVFADRTIEVYDDTLESIEERLVIVEAVRTKN